ncbi:hypothetical protein ACJX0J_007057 [Zea mays]
MNLNTVVTIMNCVFALHYDCMSKHHNKGIFKNKICTYFVTPNFHDMGHFRDKLIFWLGVAPWNLGGHIALGIVGATGEIFWFYVQIGELEESNKFNNVVYLILDQVLVSSLIFVQMISMKTSGNPYAPLLGMLYLFYILVQYL